MGSGDGCGFFIGVCHMDCFSRAVIKNHTQRYRDTFVPLERLTNINLVEGTLARIKSTLMDDENVSSFIRGAVEFALDYREQHMPRVDQDGTAQPAASGSERGVRRIVLD